MECVGIIQMTSGPVVADNLAYIATQAKALAAQGATWLVTPENAVVFGTRSDYHQHAEPMGMARFNVSWPTLRARIRFGCWWAVCLSHVPVA